MHKERIEVCMDQFGYIDPRALEAIKWRFDGATYMDFEIKWSNFCGNYTLIVVADCTFESEYPSKEEYEEARKDVTSMFINVVLNHFRMP